MRRISSTDGNQLEIPLGLAASWRQAIAAGREVLERDEEREGDTDVFRAYLGAFWEMLARMAKEAAPHDAWESFFVGDSPLIQSKKIQQQFWFGLCHMPRCFRMSASLVHAQYLLRMPDNFWRTLLEISDHGQLDFEPCRSSSKLKSVIWRIRDDYHAAERACDTEQRNAFVDFGSVVVTWSEPIPLTELFARANQVFRRLYRLNYMLYRDHYLLHKWREKNQRAASSRV